VSWHTIYAWRQKYGGPEVEEYALEKGALIG